LRIILLKYFTSSSFVWVGSSGTAWSVIVKEKKRFILLTRNCFYTTILLFNSIDNQHLNIIGYFKPIEFSFFLTHLAIYLYLIWSLDYMINILFFNDFII
jgi:hypothetical protein